MDILEIKMPCTSQDGKQFNVTPPLLFRFQYIDQDEGWSKIADSFSNVAYINARPTLDTLQDVNNRIPILCHFSFPPYINRYWNALKR